MNERCLDYKYLKVKIEKLANAKKCQESGCSLDSSFVFGKKSSLQVRFGNRYIRVYSSQLLQMLGVNGMWLRELTPQNQNSLLEQAVFE